MMGREAYGVYIAQTAGVDRWVDMLPGEQAAWDSVSRAAKTPEGALSLTMLSVEVTGYLVRARCAGCGDVWRFRVEGEGTPIECPTCSGVVRAKNQAEMEG